MARVSLRTMPMGKLSVETLEYNADEELSQVRLVYVNCGINKNNLTILTFSKTFIIIILKTKRKKLRKESNSKMMWE